MNFVRAFVPTSDSSRLMINGRYSSPEQRKVMPLIDSLPIKPLIDSLPIKLKQAKKKTCLANTCFVLSMPARVNEPPHLEIKYNKQEHQIVYKHRHKERYVECDERSKGVCVWGVGLWGWGGVVGVGWGGVRRCRGGAGRIEGVRGGWRGLYPGNRRTAIAFIAVARGRKQCCGLSYPHPFPSAARQQQ